MSIRLRDYMYLDEDLVERLLSQAEGGLASEEEQTDLEKIDKRRGAAQPDPRGSALRSSRQNRR
jgi:hypothetical protein